MLTLVSQQELGKVINDGLYYYELGLTTSQMEDTDASETDEDEEVNMSGTQKLSSSWVRMTVLSFGRQNVHLTVIMHFQIENNETTSKNNVNVISQEEFEQLRPDSSKPIATPSKKSAKVAVAAAEEEEEEETELTEDGEKKAP